MLVLLCFMFAVLFAITIFTWRVKTFQTSSSGFDKLVETVTVVWAYLYRNAVFDSALILAC